MKSITTKLPTGVKTVQPQTGGRIEVEYKFKNEIFNTKIKNNE